LVQGIGQPGGKISILTGADPGWHIIPRPPLSPVSFQGRRQAEPGIHGHRLRRDPQAEVVMDPG
jgi:hypothetical protein